IAIVGYAASLAGPGVLGALAQGLGLRAALFLVAACGLGAAAAAWLLPRSADGRLPRAADGRQARG
ncbi:MAG TPA: hypothetical protein VHN99_02715, partial [Deinococcales bacterium]|nr:hypothetical protein [Deinococcales bacterium]